MPSFCMNPELIHINKIHSFYIADFKEEYSFVGEKHDFWEMVFVISGKVKITADSDLYTLEKGQAFIHRPNELCRMHFQSCAIPRVIVISFSAEKFPNPMGKIFGLEFSQMDEIQNLYELSFTCFEREGRYVKKPFEDTSFAMQQLWCRLELLVFSIVSESPFSKIWQNTRGLKSAELYSSAVKLMEQNLSAGYSTEDIASLLSISSAYLKKIFIKYSGGGVIEYYNRLKARAACEYLARGKTAKETAELLGFGDQNYFSTFFKRIVGKSPTDFKKCK